MSQPKDIKSGSRRQSIAKLTRSPLASSPFTLNSPGRYGSTSNSLINNSTFLKKIDSKYDDVPVTSSSSSLGYPEDEANFALGIDDPKLISQLSKHLKSDNSLQHEGGDITRDIVKLGKEPSVRRSRSLSSSDFEREMRRGSGASALNVPGGFRREFIYNKQNNYSLQKPNFLAKNFVEFLSIYGHFAGEELEDEDDIACHYRPFEDQEMPLYENNLGGTATDRKAYFLLLKAFVGTGVLFLPKAFSNGGLIFSVSVLLFFGILSYWCYLILVYVKTATNVSSFGEIGLKLYGKWLQQLILSSIVISQIGFVAAYIVFTSENLKAFVSNVFNITNIDVSWYIIFQLIILLPVSLVRDITKLSLSALLANIFIFLGLLTILYYTTIDLLEQKSLGEEIEYLFNKSEFSLFIGVAIFAFEGIGLIIPIQESMIHPDHFPIVLFKVIATISSIFIGIGSLGYMTYGKKIATVIILNLPQDSYPVILTQLLYAFAILLSTPIQLFPAIRLLESKIFVKTGKNSAKVKWMKNFFRFAFVIFTSVIALFGGKNLDKFVSFVGCFACIPLVYMYPPILHLKGCCIIDKDLPLREQKKRYYLRILDYILVTIGGIALVYTTFEILNV